MWWLLSALYMAAIFFVSSRSGSELGFGLVAPWDKVIHALEYAGLALVLRQATPYAAVIASLYGISDEYHQSFVAGRSADVWDWVVDTIGAFGAVWIYQKVTIARVPNVEENAKKA